VKILWEKNLNRTIYNNLWIFWKNIVTFWWKHEHKHTYLPGQSGLAKSDTASGPDIGRSCFKFIPSQCSHDYLNTSASDLWHLFLIIYLHLKRCLFIRSAICLLAKTSVCHARNSWLSRWMTFRERADTG